MKAERAQGPKPSWGAVEKAFVSAGLTKEDALQQARLARILRHTEWDSEKECSFGHHETRTVYEG